MWFGLNNKIINNKDNKKAQQNYYNAKNNAIQKI